LLNLMFEEDIESAIRVAITGFDPRVIGISVRNIDDQNMACSRFLLPAVRDVVRTCRTLCNAPIVLGGAGYSIFPESALQYLGADMGIRGEGESAFPALLDCLEHGRDVSGLANLYLPGRPAAATTSAARLDDLPLPEPELWIPDIPASGDLWIPLQGKRGCPMRCSFCATKSIQGTRIRRRSVEAVAGWVEKLAARGFRNFVLVDTTFNTPPSYAKALCRALIERGLDITLWGMLYPKWVDAELVQLMAGAGFREVSLGFESGADEILASFHKRFNVEEVRTVSRMVADAGIRRNGFLLLGAPGESRETVEASLAFAESLNLETLKITAGLRIYPETALAAAALAEGIITPADDLLRPRFYLAPPLVDWLPERIAAYRSLHSSVM
jgi:radical SAM superfamily enzyme YgiQ (UPF0313 family)